jgi:hypothetical protein
VAGSRNVRVFRLSLAEERALVPPETIKRTRMCMKRTRYFCQILSKFGVSRHIFYLGRTLTNQNSIHEEIKIRLKPGHSCYHSVQNLLSSSLLSQTVKIKTHRTIILLVVLYGCETWSLTLRVFENRMLRKIFGPKRNEETGVEKTT